MCLHCVSSASNTRSRFHNLCISTIALSAMAPKAKFAAKVAAKRAAAPKACAKGKAAATPKAKAAPPGADAAPAVPANHHGWCYWSSTSFDMDYKPWEPEGLPVVFVFGQPEVTSEGRMH